MSIREQDLIEVCAHCRHTDVEVPTHMEWRADGPEDGVQVCEWACGHLARRDDRWCVYCSITPGLQTQIANDPWGEAPF
ncbi:MAG TPA: hypothetical protein VIJ31_12080 [Acidothermaceae bacterium]